MRVLLLITFLFPAFLPVLGVVTIQCENPAYAGRKLEFFKNADPVTGEKEFVFSLDFDSKGKSSKSVETTAITYTFCDFGIYRGMLFLEPGQIIKLQLPPVREKSFADLKNPYFVPVSFWFTTENKKQVNNQVSDLTLTFNRLTDKYFNQLYLRQSRSIYDSLLYFMERDFGNISSETFRFHKNMKLKMVETEVFRSKPEMYSRIFSSIQPEFWLHPSFTELFEKTFAGQLSFEAKSVKGGDLRKAVNRSDLAFLLNHVKNKFGLTGEIANLALLKMLHDAFYTRDFSTVAIQKLVINESFAKSKNDIVRITSLNISEKLNHLQTGKPAPVICLNTLEGTKTCTNKNRDKFKYLVFADTEMVICREQLKNISNLQKKFEKTLEIFVILRNTNSVELKKFVSENKIEGIKMIDDNNLFTEEYRVKSFPQCFLLDANHNLKLATAKAPLDGFDLQFTAVLQKEIVESQRNQTR